MVSLDKGQAHQSRTSVLEPKFVRLSLLKHPDTLCATSDLWQSGLFTLVLLNSCIFFSCYQSVDEDDDGGRKGEE